MRRLLLVPFLVAVATAAPASAQNQVCVGVGAGGPLPNTGTSFSCQTFTSPLGTYCRMTGAGTNGQPWVTANVCLPVGWPVDR